MTVRVLLVDDDALVRSGLRLMLGGDPAIEVVGEAADGAEVPAAVAEHRPDVVLMDVRMPKVDGVAATRALRAAPHPPHVLVLTTFDADDLIVAALRAGAAGYLVKDTPPEEIVRAVHAVAAGEAALSPGVTRHVVSMVREDGAGERRGRARERLAVLSPREREVAAALGSGAANAEIAEELHMSVPTVKAHVSSVLTKLGLANRVQVALLVHDAES